MTQKIVLICLALVLFGCVAFPDRTLRSCISVRNSWGGFGSGIYIRSNLILTAGHCVDSSLVDIIDVFGNTANVIESWRSTRYDIGFLIVDSPGPVTVLGKMPKLLDEVYLVATPYEIYFCSSITKGIISSLNRDVEGWVDLLQTDAEGGPGSSGGALLNTNLEIIGICVSGPNPGGGVTLCEPVKHIKLALKEYDASNFKRLEDTCRYD